MKVARYKTIKRKGAGRYNTSKPKRFAYAVSRFPWCCGLAPCHCVLEKELTWAKMFLSGGQHKNLLSSCWHWKGHRQLGVTMDEHTMFEFTNCIKKLRFTADRLPAWEIKTLSFIVADRFLRLQRTFKSSAGMYIVHRELCIAVLDVHHWSIRKWYSQNQKCRPIMCRAKQL